MTDPSAPAVRVKPTARSRVLAVAAWLSAGVFVGSLTGLALTGDPAYNAGWTVAMTVFIVALALTGATRAGGSARTAAAAAPAKAEVPRTAQLNPVSTAVPAVGTVLNGVRVVDDRARAVINRVIVAVLILAGFGAAMVPALPMIGWKVGDIAAGRPFDGTDMRTGLHLQDAVDALNQVSGGTVYTEVRFYDSYVIAEGPSVPGADTVDRYIWRWGRAGNDGPGIIQPNDRAELEAELFDVSDIDFDSIPGLVAETSASVDWEVDDVYPSVQRDGDGRVVISVSVSNEYKDATFTYSTAGELLGRSDLPQ